MASPFQQTSRRALLLGLGTVALAAPALARSLPVLPASNAGTDASYWNAVRGLYSVTPDMVNLENGYWGIMAEPVKAEYKRLTDVVNFENTVYARTRIGADLDAVRTPLAAFLGVAREEIALSRGATEALQALISGYNKLKAGDSVLYADLDYDSMQYAMNWLKDRRGVDVVKFDIPEPATRQNVLDAYDAALKANPKTKLLLLTHISHRTGLMMPVKEIAAMARARGADVILDAAHSWGQVDFQAKNLGVDFIGFNLHKWIGAPLGVGMIYIAKDRLSDIDPYMADEDFKADDIRSRLHTGTPNFAAQLAVPAALALHQEIGPQAKEARYRHLRNYWVAKARELKGVEIQTPDDPSMVAGITSFALTGKRSAADTNAIVASLRDQHKVMTVRRGGVAKGNTIRISPAPYLTEADFDRFIAALAVVSGNRAG
ncbi:aminotransferase class V-fold PLP-dependent enzyme [Bosea sp. PAMC 26642]|uniref:aminotransferase class V-fold PLP-dependent enzyme n=1 Tax=Bosea sp. (strain PAMC 26642) TaxID=1792307 RepID=UPI00077069A6|nr:aminotransferase class V-fold PLP-dependent enzyme [Bosea sp. PAMC 26642]AMJ61847.1 penicillin epimerase [Bosea sp. PAMC 26642]